MFHVKHTGIVCGHNTKLAKQRSDVIGVRFENGLVVNQHNDRAGDDCNQGTGGQHKRLLLDDEEIANADNDEGG